MSNEIAHNFEPGETLYSCRFQLNGDVFLANGASDEVWGTAGRDADDYDVAMTEKGSSGHYVGNFDPSSNIAAGIYRVVVYRQAGGSPVDADVALAQGVGEWNGTQFEPCAKKQDVLDSHVTSDALITSSHGTTDGLITSSHATTDALINTLSADQRRVLNVFGPDEEIGSQGVVPES